MSKEIKAVDSYIQNAAPFAKPILEYLRSVVFKAVPDITETIKWGMPFYEFHGNLCSMAAFKNHCAFTFWKAKLLKDDAHILQVTERDGMGNIGKIKSLEDLPSEEILIKYLHEAVQLNLKGIKKSNDLPPEKKELILHDDFEKKLVKNKSAFDAFNAMSYSHKKEYVEWINEAKRDTTRMNRIEKALLQLAEGKSKEWKYKR